MKMTGVAWEKVDGARKDEVTVWLIDTYGQSSDTTWYVIYDFDLISLMFTEQIATAYYLRWA